MTDLEKRVNDTMKELEGRRQTKLILVVCGAVAVVGVLFALTTMMYNSTPADIGEDRIDSRSFT